MNLADKRVLYISYNGMLDPLGQSQVIPYLKELSKLGVQFTLLSYERAHAFTNEGRKICRGLSEELSQFKIEWHRLRYHRRPSLPATSFDIAAGIRLASRLVKRNGIEMAHARSHIPAVIALRLKRRFGLRIIFDVRGLMAEEYVDAGHWRRGSIASRATKRMEAEVLGATDGVVTLTDALWTEMSRWPELQSRDVIHETIPCCIDQKKFRFDAGARLVRRDELSLAGRLVVVYSGSVGGWYMTNEMAAFYRTLQQKRDNAFFLWLTTGSAQIVEDAMRKAGVDGGDYSVRHIHPGHVPSYLSAADVGIAFYRRGTSRLGTSPVKVSEYLSCGLPIVINSGIGDSDRLIIDEKVGVLVDQFGDRAYSQAASDLLPLVDNCEQSRLHARQVAERLFDLRGPGLEKYARLYNALLN